MIYQHATRDRDKAIAQVLGGLAEKMWCFDDGRSGISEPVDLACSFPVDGGARARVPGADICSTRGWFLAEAAARGIAAQGKYRHGRW